MNRYWLFSTAALTLVVGVAAWGGSGVFSAAGHKIEIANHTGEAEIFIELRDDGFHPRDARVDKGTTVTFSTVRSTQFWPASNNHPGHELYPAFDPNRPLEPQETWSFVAEQPGVWGYHDHIRSYYRGILYVE
jgi:plastocyanin